MELSAEMKRVMVRVLALLLTCVVASAVASTPAVACTSTPSVGERGHGCCGERTVASAPIGACCVVSQPAGERASASRGVVSAQHNPHLAVAPGVAVFGVDRHSARFASSSSPPTLRTVPIYIQQSSLLI